MSPGRWARSLRGKRYRISPCSPLKQEVSEITSILTSSRRPEALIGAPRMTSAVNEGVPSLACTRLHFTLCVRVWCVLMKTFTCLPTMTRMLATCMPKAELAVALLLRDSNQRCPASSLKDREMRCYPSDVWTPLAWAVCGITKLSAAP